jgi:SAM-dependent methyltransferase
MIERLINEARQASSHAAKLTVLTKLLRELFGIELVDLIPSIEKKVGSKIYGFRGRTDLLFGSVIFEVKVNLERELEDAKKELKKYFQALHEIEPERRHIGIATDVINFKAYMPVIKDGQVVDISEIDSMNLSTTPIDEAILWLDSFIFHESKIRPTADDLKFRFGPGSPTYSVAVDILNSLWEEVKNEPNIKLKLDLWTKNMEIVYGSSPKEKAFIDQTYLVTIVKLIVYYRLSGDNIVRADQIKKALTGEYFQSYGIINLIEEDFFTWIFHPNIVDRALSLACDLAKELLRYDMSQIDEDLFKEIYQEIVKRSERHRIGEYYTPEWLVELTLKEALDIWFERNKDKDAPRILDPACGSGTFLCNAIRMIKDILEKKEKKSAEILDFILNNIIGIDINPLAVIIARANYLIALGELLRIGRSIVIPIYVSDSIRIPDVKNVFAHSAEEGTIQVYKIANNQYDIQIPVQVAEHRFRLGRVLSGLREALSVYRERRNKDEAKALFNRNISDILSQAELEILNGTLSTLFKLVDEQRNEIWIYILNNIYAPIALKETKFDILASNPPWIAMRYIENEEYQEFLKDQVFKYELLGRDQIHLFTQMETATLFYCMCADLYLRDQGIIAFVMPRSVLTGAIHHESFKQLKKPRMKLIRIHDLEDVSPLFNVPSCVLISIKGESTSYPVLSRKYRGELPEKNIKAAEALKHFTISEDMYKPPTTPMHRSYYYKYIKAGASIYPRCFFFIDFVVHPTLGIDIQKPRCKTSEAIAKKAKEPWKNISIEDRVEKEFIYATVIGEDLLPFGCTFRPVVLPIEPSANGYRLLNVNDLRRSGHALMANWLEKAQEFWKRRRTRKAEERFPTILDRLDYNGLLSSQNPSKRYVLLYNASGTNLVSCIVDRKALPGFEIFKARITPKGFIAEWKTYFYETDDETEAHYLCAVLNSDVVNEKIKPLQTRGLYGERDISRRPFMLPIPRFYAENQAHLRLAELSRICHEKIAVAKTMFTGKSVAGLRKQAKETIEVELKEINELVSSLLAENSENE